MSNNITTDQEYLRIGDTAFAYAFVFDSDISTAELYYEVRNSSGESIQTKKLGNGLSRRDNFTLVRNAEKCALPEGKHSAYVKLKEANGDIQTFFKIEIDVKPEKVTEL